MKFSRKLLKTIQPFLFIVLTLLVRENGFAELKLNTLFTDHAVLQQGLQVAGLGDDRSGGGKVTVKFSGQTRDAKADEAGNWMVKLDPLMASDTGTEMSAESGGDAITIKDVLRR